MNRKVGHDGGLLNIDAVVISPKFYDRVPAYGPDTMVERSKADAVAGRSADLVSDAPDCKAENDARRDSTRTDVAQSDLVRGMDVVPTDAHQIEAPPLSFDLLSPSTAAACRLAAAEPCGGDVSGTWTIAGICDPWLSQTELVSQIKASCNTQADYTVSGPATFNSDGTCTLDQTTIYKTDYPASCLARTGETCAAKDLRYKNAIGTKDVVAASCVLFGDEVCRCQDDFHSPGTSCTYSVSGNELTFVSPPDAFGAASFKYCVQGDVLSLFVAATSAVGQTRDDCNAVYTLTRPH